MERIPFGELLRRHRTEAGLTQEELAERATLSARVVSDLERGVTQTPQRGTVQQLADALGLSEVDRASFQETAGRRPLSGHSLADRGPDDSGRGAEQTAKALPVGGFVGSLPSGPIASREDEIGAIMAAIDSAADGTGQLLLLRGPRGVGKTRLAQEATLIAHQRGFLIAAGRCYQGEETMPFSPFQEALSMAYAAAPSTIRSQVARRWTQLGQLLPEQPPFRTPSGRYPATTDPSADPQAEQQRLIQAVTGFLSAIAQERPLALLLDDVHWADEATLRLLAHLARQTRGRRVFILATSRDSELALDTPLNRTLRDLVRERLVERVAVRRLMPEGTAAMVAAIVGEMEMSEEFIDFVHRRTKGLPFFVEELLRSLGGHYRLIRELGAGGMGRVFQAIDTRTGQSVAIKIMFASREAGPDAVLRFEQEGEVLAALQHPNIVEVHGTFMQEHASCIVMELLEGCSLAEILRHPEGGPGGAPRLDLARIKRIARQVAAALVAAHKRGIVHRDIKPDNVMVLVGDQVKVTDFGIARVLRPQATIHTMTTTGMTLGTPLYMSPEQIEGKKVDGRADVYALGAVLYQMVTGRPPFEAADPLTIALKHINERPEAPGKVRRGIPKDWEALILKALAKDPADRFQSALALEAAIAELSTDGAKLGGAKPAGTTREATSMPRRSLLRVLTPPGPAPGRAKRVAGGTALPLPAERIDATAIAASLAQRARASFASRPARFGAAAVVLVALATGLLLRVSHSSGSATNLQPVAVWAAQSPGTFQQPDGVAVDAQGNWYVLDEGAARIHKLSPTGQPVGQWPGPRTTAGQLHGTGGIAVDHQGNIYMADLQDNRIQKFSSDGTLEDTWGTKGTLPGQFDSPWGIALDHQGNIYVADAGNGRIQVLSPRGRPLYQWGSKDSSPLVFPVAVAVDTHGNVYVVDTPDGRIKKFSPTGKPLLQWRSKAALNAPAGLAVDAAGNIYATDAVSSVVEKLSPAGSIIWSVGFPPPAGSYLTSLAVDDRGHLLVADENNQRVIEFSTSTGKQIAQWTETGTGLTFASPTGVAVDTGGNLYVADSGVNGRLYKLSPLGLPDPRWQTGSSSSGFEYKGVAVGSDGTVYVSDEINSQVLVFSSTGRRRAAWIDPTTGPFDAPSGLAYAHTALYVADTGNDRIVKLSHTSEARRTWGTPGAALGQFTSPASVAVDAAGNVYAVDSANNTLQKISPRGEFVALWGSSGSGNGQFNSPSAVAVDGRGDIYIADTGNNRIQELSSNGSFIRAWGTKGSLPGQFQSPRGIAVDARGNIYVADTDNRRIQKFAPPT